MRPTFDSIVSIFVLLSASVYVSRVTADSDDDQSMLSAPTVDCQLDAMTFDIETKKPFAGRLFVKGHSGSKDCSADFSTRTDDGNLTRAEMTINYQNCNTERIRSVAPNGVTYVATITIQFHRTFITKGDKSYRVRCFYAEQDKTVSSDFEVSTIVTNSIAHDMPLPLCIYSVRAATPNGPVVRTTTVGDLVYHRWECSNDANVYGMLVHSCLIENDAGKQTLMIDPIGCSADPTVVAHLSYNNEANLAYTSSRVFKYPDDVNVRFRCQIRICTKIDGGCEGLTPPNCETNRRIKRSVSDYVKLSADERAETVRRLYAGRSMAPEVNLDVVSDELLVFDERALDETRLSHQPPKQPRRVSWQVERSSESFIPITESMSSHRKSSSLASYHKPERSLARNSSERLSIFRRNTETTQTDSGYSQLSDVHASRKELCVNRLILICILCGFILFFVGSMSFVVYVMLGQTREVVSRRPSNVSLGPDDDVLALAVDAGSPASRHLQILANRSDLRSKN